MHIEFIGRAVRITTQGHRGYLFPDEIFELIRWAKDHEFQLIEKQREIQLMEEQRQQRQAKEQ